MQESRYGLQYDYIHQSGDYIIFSKKEGLQSSELTNLQVKMLQANSIPKLLPLEIEEKDLIVQLRYNFSSKRLLSHSLKGQKLLLSEYYMLLFSIASTLDDSKIYMLKEEGYILHEDFIYLGRDYDDIHLIYIPLHSIQEKKKVREELKALAMNLIGSVQELQGDSFQDLMNYFKDEHFSVVGLKKKLVPLMNNSVVSPKSPPVLENKKIIDEKIDEKEDKNIKTYFFLGALVLIALIWRGYLEIQSEGALYLSIGLSILVGNLVFIFLKIWRPGMKTKIPPIIEKKNHYENLHKNTTFLAKSNATVLLNEQSQNHARDSEGPKAILEVQREGNVEKIEISQEGFIIGRNAEMANYVEDSVAVSRAHTELRFNGKEYKVKDLGSRNGTLLNQQQLIPNKEYAIEEGDLLLIAKTEFIFKME